MRPRTFHELTSPPVDLNTLSPFEWAVYVNGYHNSGWGVRWPLKLLVARVAGVVRIDPDTKRFRFR